MKNEISSSQRLVEIQTQIKQAQSNYEQAFLEIGTALLEAKQLLTKHGEWLTWINSNIDMSPRKAQRLMQTAQFFTNATLVSHLNFSQAYVLTALPPNAIDKFLATKHLVEKKGKYMRVQEMSKRELEEAVRKFLSTYNTDSSSAPAPKKAKSPAASMNDFDANYKKTQDALAALVKIVDKDPTPSNSRNLRIADLCDLCTEILQKFAVRDMDTF